MAALVPPLTDVSSSHGEGDQRAGAVEISTLLDGADADAGDPDVVALVDAGGVGELGLVVARVAEA